MLSRRAFFAAGGSLAAFGADAPKELSRIPVPVEVHVSDLGEGFRLSTVGGTVRIEGGTRGCLYGAYEFLERLGYRWFTPDVEVTPRRIVVPKLEIEERPVFAYREAFFTEAQDGNWSVRNRLNGHFHKLEARHGGRFYFQPWAHSFVELVPPTLYFAQHPEYFALVGGKRLADGQLCLSNPDVLRISIERVREWTVSNPDASAYSVSQNDNAPWCECAKCEEQGPTISDRLIRFVNQVAKAFPNKTIDTLAYLESLPAPRQTRPEANVLIRYCPFDRCQSHIEKAGHYEAWGKIARHLMLWRYSANFSHYLAPFPNLVALIGDVRRPHWEGVFVQGGGNGSYSDGADLRAYLVAKLLWNPHTDVKRHMREFLQGVYGAAAPAMGRYWKLEQRAKEHVYTDDGLDVPYLTPRLLMEGRQTLSEAERLAPAVAKKRVARYRLSLDYIEAMRARRFHVVGASYEPVDVAAKSKTEKMFSEARLLDITTFRDDYPLDTHARILTESTRAYGTVRLAAGELSIVAVPELDGRIVSIQRKGKELLAATDVGEWAYPYAGGIFARIYPDPPREWHVETSDGRIAMTTRADGMEARLAYMLNGLSLVCACTVINSNQEALDVKIAWRAALGNKNSVESSPETRLTPTQSMTWRATYSF